MLYTNYKQVAKIILKSEDSLDFTTKTETVATVASTIVTKYTYNITLPFYKFSKNTRLAVESFSLLSEDFTQRAIDIGDVFILNIKKSNVYHSNPKSNKGTCILSTNLSKSTEYFNPDITKNSIDITGNTGFMEGNPLEIFVDTKIGNDTTNDVGGCIDTAIWSLTLVIFEEEKEENPKDYVDDRTNNFSKPSLY